MSSFNKYRKSLIISSDFLCLPSILNKLTEFKIDKICHWHYKNLSLIEFNTVPHLKKELAKFRRFPVIPDVLNFSKLPISKLTDLRKYLYSNFKITEIVKCETSLFRDLMSADSLTSQIKIYCEFMHLTDEDENLRFCYAAHLQHFLSKISTVTSAELRGSSVNGLGKYNSDLDIRLLPDRPHNQCLTLLRIVRNALRLEYSSGIRSPFVFSGQYPICDYYDEVLQFEVDLSVKADTSHRMSLLVSRICASYPALVPLTLVIKHIYHHYGVITDQPNVHFSGFKIFLFIIHFLQQQHGLSALETFDCDSVGNGSADTTAIAALDKGADLGSLLTGFFQFLLAMDPSLHIDLGRSEITPLIQNSMGGTEDARSVFWCPSHLDPDRNMLRNMRHSNWLQLKAVTDSALSLLLRQQQSPSKWGLLHFLDSSNLLFDQDRAPSTHTIHDSPWLTA